MQFIVIDGNSSYQHEAGRLIERSSLSRLTAGAAPTVLAQRYAYDSLERLAQIKYINNLGQAGEQLLEQIDYGYDANGRRTSKTTLNNNGSGQGETPMNATYDAANRMTAISLNIAGSTQTYNLSYDAVGNLTTKQHASNASDTTTYRWDASNRLVQITQAQAGARPAINASYTYDAFSRRIQATLQVGGNAAETVQYLYEGSQALGEIRNGSLSHRLITGLSLDETIARIAIQTSGANAGSPDAQNSRIYLTDALNSVIANLSAQGNLQTSYGYSPYGEAQQIGPDGTNNPNQYTSRENDNTGLMFYRARYYDPVLKRFISQDPMGMAAGMNVYRAMDNDPISLADPEGELPIVPLAIAYARCIASCMAQNAVTEAITGDISCYDVGDNAKECALDCLNPLNYLGGGAGKMGAKGGKTKKTGKQKSSDVPSWAKGEKPNPGESGKNFADRLLDDKYGKNN